MEIELSDRVITPYGLGEVKELRKNESQIVVKLDSGGVAYLADDVVERKKKLFEMNDFDKLQAAKHHREEGNTFFRLETFQLALEKYELSRVYLRQLEDKSEHVETTIVLLNNIALTHSKLGNLSEVISTCDEAFALFASSSNPIPTTPAEIKCVYLRGSAKRKKGDLEGALSDYALAVKAQPKNKSIRDEYDSCKVDLKKSKQKEVNLFKNAFQAAAKEDEMKNEEEKKKVELFTKKLVKTNNNSAGTSSSFFSEYGSTLIVGAVAIGFAFLILSNTRKSE